MLKTILLCTVFILLAFSCSRPPYHATNKVYKKQAKIFAATIKSNPENISVDIRSPAYWVGTTNFNLRKPNFVIIHHTAQNSCDQTLKTFTLPRTQVSAHYVICKDGIIHHMLNDYLRAWHGGELNGAASAILTLLQLALSWTIMAMKRLVSSN